MLQEKLAYSYIRMSTEIQLQGDSLRRQEEKSKAYAEKHGLVIDTNFTLKDIGVSAFNGKNVREGDLGRFLAAVESGQIRKGSYLLVESLDRISRQNIKASAGLILQIINAGINVVTVSDSRVYGSETDFADLMYALIVLSRAHEESATKSMRLSSVWESKRSSASTKKMTGIAPAWLKLTADRSDFVIDTSKAEAVRLIFQLADLGFGSNAIVRKFNGEKRPTIGRSGEWHQSYITKILKNRAVLGEYQPHKIQSGKRVPVGTPMPDYFPPIIEESLFYRVQSARRGRQVGSGGRKGTHLSNLFTHVATCGYCKNPMRFINKGIGPKGGTYLKCSGAVRGMDCSKVAWKYDDFEESFLLFVQEVDLKSVLSEAANSSLRQQISMEISVVTEKIHDLEQRRKRVFDLYTSGGTALDFVRSELTNLETEIQAKKTDKLALEAKYNDASAKPDLDMDEMRKLIDEIRDRQRSDLFEKRSAIAKRLQSIVKRLEVRTEGDHYQLSQKLNATFGSGSIEVSEFLESQRKAGSANRSFTVELADGVSRTAVVSGSDPADFILTVHNDNEFVRGTSEHGSWMSPVMDADG